MDNRELALISLTRLASFVVTLFIYFFLMYVANANINVCDDCQMKVIANQITTKKKKVTSIINSPCISFCPLIFVAGSRNVFHFSSLPDDRFRMQPSATGDSMNLYALAQ